MSETKMLPVTVYRTPYGVQTCASNWETGDICIFLQTYKFGCAETCFFIPDQNRKKVLRRSGKNENGYLIPFNNCPLLDEEK